MKKFNLICSVLLSVMFAEDIDILNLKNGDLIKGKIIEHKINEYIKIELQGGTVLTYTYDQIESIEREEINTETFAPNANNNKSITGITFMRNIGGILISAGAYTLYQQQSKECPTCDDIEDWELFSEQIEKFNKRGYTMIMLGGLFIFFDLEEVLNKSLQSSSKNKSLNFNLQPTYQGANLTMSYSFN